MKEVKAIDIELAVRSLGMPNEYRIETETGRLYADGAVIYEKSFPILEMTFEIPLTPEIASYLPEMRDRYNIWISLQRQMETGLSALDD